MAAGAADRRGPNDVKTAADLIGRYTDSELAAALRRWNFPVTAKWPFAYFASRVPDLIEQSDARPMRSAVPDAEATKAYLDGRRRRPGAAPAVALAWIAEIKLNALMKLKMARAAGQRLEVAA